MVTINLLNESQPTVKGTLAVIRAMGLSVRHRDGEYRVTLTRQTIEQRNIDKAGCLPSRNFIREYMEDCAYYTNDAADAIGTARAMIRK